MNSVSRLLAFLAAALLLGRISHSEIIHYSPGWIPGGPHEPFPVDLDQDGSPEFWVSGSYITTGFGGGSYSIEFRAREGAELLTTTLPSLRTWEFEPGEWIAPDPGASNVWWNLTAVTGMPVTADLAGFRRYSFPPVPEPTPARALLGSSLDDESLWHGPVGNINNRFVGVRFSGPDGFRYAWIRLVARYHVAGVQEWAFESRPDTAIRAGETVTPAGNDLLADRLSLEGIFLDVTASNIGASIEPGEPHHADLSAGSSLWWAWTAPTNGWLRLDSSQSSIAPCFAVYRGGMFAELQVVALSPFKCLQRDWGRNVELSRNEIFPVQAGETYQIAFASAHPPDEVTDDAPRGQIRFSLVFSTVEIIDPPDGATFITGTEIPVQFQSSDFDGPYATLSLEMDGQQFASKSTSLTRPDIFVLTNVPQGPHTLQVRSRDMNGPDRLSPPIQVNVRPPNDRFVDAQEMTGRDWSAAGSSYFATTEVGELGSGNGDTVWYRWTAPADGTVRLSTPNPGGSVALAVFRGLNPSDLERVAVNPAQQNLSPLGQPLYPFLHFAAKAGHQYMIRVSTQQWSPMPLRPDGPCDPILYWGGPFFIQAQFIEKLAGSIDLAFEWSLRTNAVCFFALAPGQSFALETSPDLTHWTVAAQGIATGSTERVSIPLEDPRSGAFFFRVRSE